MAVAPRLRRTLRSKRHSHAARIGTVTEATSALHDRDAIVDADALARDLRSRYAEGGSDPDTWRTTLLPIARDALSRGEKEIERRFIEEAVTGDVSAAERAFLIDRLVQAIADLAEELLYPAPNPTSAERLTIVATGGYGRGELAPQSDIDLLFLLPYRRTPRIEQIVETLLYMLWDLGLKVGQAVRSIDECIRWAKQDMTIRTNLLESRPIWGDLVLYHEFKRRYLRDVVAGTGQAFVEAKMAERDGRHHRMGESRYVLEPNIKEGKGGLRDLQTLYWIGKYLFQTDDPGQLVSRGVLTQAEANRFQKAHVFLWTVRCHLHYVTRRAEDRLTFDVQNEIGRRMGYTDRKDIAGVERFMRHYFLVAKEVGSLTRIFCAALEAESQGRPRRGLTFFLRGQKSIDGFLILGDRLTVQDPGQFEDRPVDMLRLFHVAQRTDLDVHPGALRQITRNLRLIGPDLRQDAEANQLFMEMLTSPKDPETTLRRMNEAGVLGRFLPDFNRVVAQMQYDMYHVYTTDEHTLLAIGTLSRIESGKLAKELPLACEVAGTVVSRRALYVALLLHDIAKGRGGDHSVLGARIARSLGPRLGLDAEETETVEWLVRFHLLMSRVSQKRDIEDDKTVQDFAEAVESPERLRLLLVLTTVDIHAVGPGRLTAWKGTLLANLFQRTMAVLTGGLAVESRDRRVRTAQDAMAAALPEWSEAAIQEHIALAYPPYWLAFDAETHARQARLMRQARQDDRPLTLETRVDVQRAVTEITIYATDHPGLFSRLAGALAVSGATIVDAKIATMTDGMALDVFTVQDAALGGPLEAPEKLARLSVNVERALAGHVQPLKELAHRSSSLPSRTKVFRVQLRVLIDNHASRTHTVIEINGRDRPGLLYDITRALTHLSLQIGSAVVSTYGERAVDVFYVKDIFGLKVTHQAKQDQIRDRLLEALRDPDGEPAPAAPVIPYRRRRAATARRGGSRVGGHAGVG